MSDVLNESLSQRIFRIEAEAATREREARRKKKADEIRKKDAERQRVRAAEREQEAQEHVAAIKEHWRSKMSATMPQREFDAWWFDNKLRILEEEARAHDAALTGVGGDYASM